MTSVILRGDYQVPVKNIESLLSELKKKGGAKEYVLTQDEYYRRIVLNLERRDPALMALFESTIHLNMTYGVGKTQFQTSPFGGYSHSERANIPAQVPPLDYTTQPKTLLDDSSLLAHNDLSFEGMIPFWYRYLGTKHYVDSLISYQEAVLQIRSFALSDEEKKRILVLIAIATTHKRGSTVLNPDLIKHCFSLVSYEAQYRHLVLSWSGSKPTLHEWHMLHLISKLYPKIQEQSALDGEHFLIALSGVQADEGSIHSFYIN